jgi:hypothetical protein
MGWAPQPDPAAFLLCCFLLLFGFFNLGELGRKLGVLDFSVCGGGGNVGNR